MKNCPRCDMPDRLSINPGKGPHYRELRCDRCSRFVKWLSRSAYAATKSEGVPEKTQCNLFDQIKSPHHQGTGLF